MSFKAITTQEELDAIIGERLKRERETLSKKFSDYDEIKSQNEKYVKELNVLKSELEKNKESIGQLEELSKKNKMYEMESLKIKYALENGIPYRFASRISGNTEDEIKEDAENLAEVFSRNVTVPPLKTTEKTVEDDEERGYKKMLEQLEGE